jgi:HAD superfamily hydrolase (TIGR01509 family)
MNTKAILWDADGVLITPAEPFMVAYARQHHLDLEMIKSFFHTDFRQALIGQADLKDLIKKRQSLWQLSGSIDDFLATWFHHENQPNLPLVSLIKRLRQQGQRCYLTTNQEKYRTAFIKEKMFPHLFHDVFTSAEIGAAKPSPQYFQAVLHQLAAHNIPPSAIIFFDDNPPNVAAAKTFGINGYVYQNVNQVKKILKSTL